MIAYRYMGVVWIQCILGTSEHGPNVESMVLTSKEVRVVPNLHGQVHLHALQREQT